MTTRSGEREFIQHSQRSSQIQNKQDTLNMRDDQECVEYDDDDEAHDKYVNQHNQSQ